MSELDEIILVEVFLFKVKDYTTILVGQRNEDEKYFFVQRGDGTMYKYNYDRIVWSKLISVNSISYEERTAI